MSATLFSFFYLHANRENCSVERGTSTWQKWLSNFFLYCVFPGRRTSLFGLVRGDFRLYVSNVRTYRYTASLHRISGWQLDSNTAAPWRKACRLAIINDAFPSRHPFRPRGSRQRPPVVYERSTAVGILLCTHAQTTKYRQTVGTSALFYSTRNV